MPLSIRNDVRRGMSGVSRAIVHQFGRLEATTEKTPAPAETGPGRDQLTEGVDMHNRTQVRDGDNKRLIALEYLQRVADDLSRVTVLRIEYIKNARTHGATWRDISWALGMTETGARLLYERNRDLLCGDA